MDKSRAKLKKDYNYVHPSRGLYARLYFERLEDDATYYGKYSRYSLAAAGGMVLVAAIVGVTHNNGSEVLDGMLAGGIAMGVTSAGLTKYLHLRNSGRKEAYIDEAQEHFRFCQAEAPDWLERALADRPGPADINLPQ